MQILVGFKTISSTQTWTPATKDWPIAKYEGFDWVEGIYKDHRLIKRELRRLDAVFIK